MTHIAHGALDGDRRPGLDCKHERGKTPTERKEHPMETMPTVENAATRFNAKTVTHHLDVVDRRAASSS